MNPIYLDHNATTPILPEVAETVRECQLTHGANPASQHAAGRAARRALENAREQIAEILGARLAGPTPDRVIFTSGGTEANNLALRGGIARRPSELRFGARQDSSSPIDPSDSEQERPPGRIVVSAIEHPSVIGAAESLARCGWIIDSLPVDQQGVVCLDAFSSLLTNATALVSVMLGNHETGAIQPVRRVAEIAASAGIPVHTDASQAVGKIEVYFSELGVAMMSCAAHKFHGPLGIGALIVRGDYPLQPILFGGFQQAGFRPGTEPVALAVGMARALEIWRAERESRQSRLTRLRDQLESLLLAGWPSAVVHSARSERLPQTTNISFPGLDRQAMVVALDMAGIACSTGSACASGSSELSPVLLAMGCEKVLVEGSIRLSLGRSTTAAEVEESARRILRVANDLRHASEAQKSGAAPPPKSLDSLQ